MVNGPPQPVYDRARVMQYPVIKIREDIPGVMEILSDHLRMSLLSKMVF
jgi:hypothetical protein